MILPPHPFAFHPFPPVRLVYHIHHPTNVISIKMTADMTLTTLLACTLAKIITVV